jgi:hypothetical protein
MEFGFLPRRLDIVVGSIMVQTLPDFQMAIDGYETWDGVERGWIYAGPQEVRSSKGVHLLPYPSRVFGLRKTHSICHATADGDAHIRFLVWGLSFLHGMRLTTTGAGFLDATPIKPGTLVDFQCGPKSLNAGLLLFEGFWQTHRTDSVTAKRLVAAINALFIAQRPQHLQIEEFIFLYAALDACFALLKTIKGTKTAIGHHRRIEWMCGEFGMKTPDWAVCHGKSSAVSELRNNALHEALFVDEPLGFAVHGIGSPLNLTLEMRVLICRLLVAIVGGERTSYVHSPVGDRMTYLLELN